MPKPIVAAIDPGREDVAPAALGLLLAHLSSSPLILTAACPTVTYADSLFPEFARGSRREAEEALSRVARLVEHAANAAVPVTTLTAALDSSPAHILHDVAASHDASMIVIGSSARGRAGRLLPGAVTDRLLQGAPCTVAIAPVGYAFDDARAGLRLLGVASNDTPDARAALATACILARQARGAVRVLTVAEPLHTVTTATLDYVGREHVRRARDEEAERTLGRGLDLVSPGRSAGGEILAGDPADALAAVSADLDLLVCGSRGYGPVRTLIMGGTSRALVRKAACPVLVVPRSADGADGAAVTATPSPWRSSRQAAPATGTTCGRHPIAGTNALAHTGANASYRPLG